VGICANFVNDPAGWGEGLPRYLHTLATCRTGALSVTVQDAFVAP